MTTSQLSAELLLSTEQQMQPTIPVNLKAGPILRVPLQLLAEPIKC
jgi:hypothetical protein